VPINGVNANQLALNICTENQDYYVRAKDAGCTVSSLYSLPLKLPYCKRRGFTCPPIYCGGRITEDLLTISPNPNIGHFDILFDSANGNELRTADTHIGIYDMLGSLQKQYDIDNTNPQSTTIDISALPSGTYWVTWFANGEAIDTQQVQKTN